MALQIVQVRYYDEENSLNSQGFNSYNTLCGTTGLDAYSPIRHLGVQALPGTRMYFNNSVTPVIIGATGIYELDLRENTTAILHSIRFDRKSMEIIRDTPNAYLIIDIVYDGGGKG